jgi:predicted Zn-ribbon and HTH transcriptional regulator
MMQTIRQSLMALLENGPATALDLSGLAGIPEKDVYAHLEHIRKACQRHGKQLKVDPPRCRDCGFIFAKRDRLKKPGKCPRCRGSFITAPVFSITS